MIRVLGLLGQAGIGKSSTAEFMAQRYGAKRLSLAGPLKEIAKATMGFSDEQLYGTQAQKEAIDPRYGFSARTYLQRLGTDGVRTHLGEYVWSEALFRKIRRDVAANPHGKHLYVIDDLRFRSEVRAVYDVGHSVHGARGYVFHLRPPIYRQTCVSGHQSETESTGVAVAEVNAEIISDVSLGVSDLFAKVRHAWERVEGRPPLVEASRW